MPEPRRLIIVAKQHEFDEERWRQLLMTLAYVLHEQHKQQATGDAAEDATGQAG
jgi:hypothetical protein